MFNLATQEIESDIGLIENVGTFGGIVVSRNGHQRVTGINRARINVLVELTVIGNACGVTQRNIVAELMVNDGVECIHSGPGRA